MLKIASHANRPEMVRQLTAIMFTDMVGYTALMQEDERQAMANRDRQRSVLEQSIEHFGGRILQFYGDGTLSVFQSAVAAVESGIAIQEALTSVEPVIPIRIGIHSGDVVHDENGVFGDGVNVASRIEGLGVAGAVLMSGKVFDEVKNQPDIKTRGLGSFNLKNIKHPTRVYAVANPGMAVPSEATLRPDRAARTRSIAVLPFVNMSSDAENEFFSDGITEEIINALTRVNGLQVTARTSSFVFKNHNEDVRAIASKLDVTHVLEGSVRRAGDRVRVTAQLISAKDGYHLMSEVYDGTLDDIFALQDEISLKIVEHLADRLGPVPTADAGSAETLVHGHSHDTEAYAEYLKGRFQMARFAPESSRAAIGHFERSIELDPDCSLPFTGLATAYVLLGAMGQMTPTDAYRVAEEAADKALAIEEGLGEAHMVRGLVRFFYHWDWDGAYRSFQKALSLTPGSASVHEYYSMYLRALGETGDALREAEIALSLDPLSSSARRLHAETLMLTGEVDQAEVLLTQLIADDPNFRSAVESMGLLKVYAGDLEAALEYFDALPGLAGKDYAGAAVRGYTNAVLGRTDTALEMLALLEQRAKDDPEAMLSQDFALVHQGLGNVDEVFAFLEETIDRRSGGVMFLGGQNPWPNDVVTSDPRYLDLLQRIAHPAVLAEAGAA